MARKAKEQELRFNISEHIRNPGKNSLKSSKNVCMKLERNCKRTSLEYGRD